MGFKERMCGTHEDHIYDIAHTILYSSPQDYKYLAIKNPECIAEIAEAINKLRSPGSKYYEEYKDVHVPGLDD